VAPLFRSASSTPFDRLYRQHAAAVYRYARAVLGNHADAEDVTQQTFLNAYRAMAQGTKPRKAENWVFTIAHNEIRRHLRDTRAQKYEVELDTELADHAQERVEPSVTDVLRALQHLTPNQRSALVLREFEGRSYAEISELMEISPGALETLMFRARRSLAEALEDGLTCAEAELAVSRRLDGRLSRREARRLKKHVRECDLCKGFGLRQKRQRSLLEGLSVIPVPASLLVFRGEQAAAAIGGGTAVGAAAAGGSAGIAAKAAAVAAAVTVAGGVGYTAGTDQLPVIQGKEPKASLTAAVKPTPRRALPVAAPARVHVQRPAPLVQLRKSKPAPKPKLAVSKADRPVQTTSAKAATKAERKAAKLIDRPTPPGNAASTAKVKPPKAGIPTRKRPVHDPKPKAEKQPPAKPERPARPEPPTKPEQPAKPELPTASAQAPEVPPGLEKKLLDESKQEKAKLP
jgi:RNA polymerase sigma factor (sigma-70 family)